MRVCNRHRFMEAAGTVKYLRDQTEVDLCQGCLDWFQRWAAENLPPVEQAKTKRGRPKKDAA